MAEERISFPVQDMSRKETSSEMDPRYYEEISLSIEETSLSIEETSNSQFSKCEEDAMNKPQEEDTDTALYGGYTTEDAGQDYKLFINNVQDSCMSIKINVSEALEDKSKTSEGPSTKVIYSSPEFDNPIVLVSEDNLTEENLTPEVQRNNSTIERSASGDNSNVGFQPNEDKSDYNDDVSNIRDGDDTTMITMSEDSTTVSHEENNLAHGEHILNYSTTIFEPGHKGDEGCKTKGENVSNLITDDGTNIGLIHPCCELQGGDDVNQEGRNEELAQTNPSSPCSESLNNVLMVPEDNTTMIMKSKDSTIISYGENNLEPEEHRSNNITTMVPEPGHNDEVDCKPTGEIFASHESDNRCPAVSKRGVNDSNVKIDDEINVDGCAINPGCELQDVANMDRKNTVDPENKTSTDHNGGNNDYSCHRPNINERRSKAFDGNSAKVNCPTDLQQDSKITKVIWSGSNTTMIQKSVDNTRVSYEESNLACGEHGSINSTTTNSGPGDNGDVDSKPTGEIFASHESDNRCPAVSQRGVNDSNVKIDDDINVDGYTTNPGCELRDGANMDKNKTEDPENKTSTDHNGGNNDYSCHRPNINEGRSKALDCNSPNDNCFTDLQQDSNVTKLWPGDETTMILNSVDNTTVSDEENNLARGVHTSNNSTNTNSEPGDTLHRPSTQHQSQATKRSCNSLVTDNPTNVQQGGSDSVVTKPDDHSFSSHEPEICTSSENKIEKQEHSRRSSRTDNARNVNKALVLIFYVMPLLMVPWLTQAFPVQKVWHQFWFIYTNGSFTKELQSQNIKNMEDRSAEDCAFKVTNIPFFHNCSGSGYFLFAKNATHIEMFTLDPNTMDYIMEHGNNGDRLIAKRGGTLDDVSLKAKIGEYTEPPDNTTPPKNKTPPSRFGGTDTVGTIVGSVLGPVHFLLLLLFGLLYGLASKFKR